MKKVFVFVLLISSFNSFSQYYPESSGAAVKLHGGFAHDFPGLNGPLLSAEYTQWMSDRLQAGVALKRYNLSGTPRTNLVNEYTKSTTIDFNVYFSPIKNDIHLVKIGAGYSFSFYSIRRSFPVYHSPGQSSDVSWPTTDKKGRVSGIILMGEYEYLIPASDFSIGLKVAYGKAYDHVTSVGPFVGYHF